MSNDELAAHRRGLGAGTGGFDFEKAGRDSGAKSRKKPQKGARSIADFFARRGPDFFSVEIGRTESKLVEMAEREGVEGRGSRVES